MLKVSAPEMVSGVSGESEQKLRELFDLAVVSPPVFFFFVIMFSEILIPEKMSSVPEKYFLHTIKGPCGLMILLFSDFSFLSPPAELRTVYLVHRRDRCNYPQERRGL